MKTHLLYSLLASASLLFASANAFADGPVTSPTSCDYNNWTGNGYNFCLLNNSDKDPVNPPVIFTNPRVYATPECANLYNPPTTVYPKAEAYFWYNINKGSKECGGGSVVYDIMTMKENGAIGALIGQLALGVDYRNYPGGGGVDTTGFVYSVSQRYMDKDGSWPVAKQFGATLDLYGFNGYQCANLSPPYELRSCAPQSRSGKLNPY